MRTRVISIVFNGIGGIAIPALICYAAAVLLAIWGVLGWLEIVPSVAPLTPPVSIGIAPGLWFIAVTVDALARRHVARSQAATTRSSVTATASRASASVPRRPLNASATPIFNRSGEPIAAPTPRVYGNQDRPRPVNPPQAAIPSMKPRASTRTQAEFIELRFDDLRDMPSLLRASLNRMVDAVPPLPPGAIATHTTPDQYHVRRVEGECFDIRRLRVLAQ